MLVEHLRVHDLCSLKISAIKNFKILTNTRSGLQKLISGRKMKEANKSQTKLSHKTPQFLLRNFAYRKDVKEKKKDQYYIYQFNKETGGIGTPNIVGACSENRFYEAGNIKIEEAFEKVETATAPIISKITDEGTIANLTFDEKQQVAFFIACQFARTDAFRQNQQIIINSEKALFEEIAVNSEISLSENERYKTLKFFTESEEGKKLHHISSFNFSTLYTHSSMIMDKDWVLFITDDDNPFIIGDSPVILHNSDKSYPYLGLVAPGIEIYMPISKRLTIGFCCKSIVKKNEGDYKENEEKMMIIKQLYHQNYRHLTSQQKIEVEALLKQGEVRNDYINSIKNQVPIFSDSERIRFFNQQQAIFAERFVYSSKQDFSLVKELIAINPVHKKGWNIKT